MEALLSGAGRPVPWKGWEMTRPQDGASIPKLRILVVEDDPRMATLISDLLSGDGYAVDAVLDGAEALSQVGARTYALIISDIRMPRMDGLDLYRAIELVAPHLCQRIIFITGYPLSCDSQVFEDETGVPILRKPFRIHDLRRLVQLMLTAS